MSTGPLDRAARSVGAIYTGPERRELIRHDRLEDGLRVAAELLDELARSARWKFWRRFWARRGARVIRALLAARRGGGEGVRSGASVDPQPAGFATRRSRLADPRRVDELLGD